MPAEPVCCCIMFVVVSHASKHLRTSTRVLWFWIVVFGMWVSVFADSIPSAYTSTHDVVLSAHDTSSFNIHFSSPVPTKIVLRFHLDSPGVLASIADRTVWQNTSSPITVPLRPKAKGHCTISAISSLPRDRFNVDEVYVRVNVLESFGWSTFSAVVGWMYFIAWTVSFYPQIYENYRRKSVIGLNFDFLALNIVGFAFYSVFNCSLFWSRRIQEMYFSLHPYGLVPVASNDVVFGLHALFASAVTITQCLVYERGSQRVYRATLLLLSSFAVVILVALVVVVCDVISWLQFIYVFSYVKLVITVVKYVPQAWFNYRRRSTEGWSIGNVLLDFTGGSLSILQMFVEAYNYDDWSSIFGNPTKFGLGAFSVLFDVLFVVQHYWLYRNNTFYVPIDDSPEVATEPLSV